MKAVVDANVLVSAFLWDGPEKAVIDAARAGRCKLGVSQANLTETARTLRVKFNVPTAQVDSHLARLMGFLAPLDPPSWDRQVARDPSDDRVLEAAVAWAADAIVTGDKDLLDLGTFEGIAILRAPAFLRRLEDAKP